MGSTPSKRQVKKTKNATRVPSITFVFILKNAASMVEETLAKLVLSIDTAEWSTADILVVDDGSTDDTVKVIRQFSKSTKVPVKILSQENQGRMKASMNGTKAAKGDLVSFIGSRCMMHKNSLKFLKKQLLKHPDRKVWNCHVEVVRKGNIQARFWHVLTFVAWRRYLRRPRYVSFGSEDFDYYPKGTGGFICPRELLLEGYAQMDSIYNNEKFASDDTTLIRYIATKERIHMDPGYSVDYAARSSLKSFIIHTYGRGIFLLDSYLRPGTRFFVPIIIYFIVFIPLIVLLVIFPALLLAIPVGIAVVFVALLAFGLKVRDAAGFCFAAPIFAVVYSIGMWKGLWMLVARRSQA